MVWRIIAIWLMGAVGAWADLPRCSMALHAYDGAGNQITLTNRNGNRWQFQFDAANRLTNTITPMGRTNVLAFNTRGLLSALTNSLGHGTTYGYDAMGRLTNRVDSLATDISGYDANSNPLSVTEGAKSNV